MEGLWKTFGIVFGQPFQTRKPLILLSLSIYLYSFWKGWKGKNKNNKYKNRNIKIEKVFVFSPNRSKIG